MDLEQIKNSRTNKILQFSVPSIIAMMLTSFITIADGYFMGNYVGKEGITAVNLGLPIIYLYLGIGLMVSIGGAAIAGMSLGSGDREKCNQVFRQTIAVTACASALLSCIMFFCFQPMLAILHADDRVTVHFREYYQIMLLEMPVMVVNSSFGMFIRGEGSSRYYMKVSILSVLLNILLDGLLAGCFHRGAAGIATASLVSELVCLLCILYFFGKKRTSIIWGNSVFPGKSVSGQSSTGAQNSSGRFRWGSRCLPTIL